MMQQQQAMMESGPGPGQAAGQLQGPAALQQGGPVGVPPVMGPDGTIDPAAGGARPIPGAGMPGGPGPQPAEGLPLEAILAQLAQAPPEMQEALLNQLPPEYLQVITEMMGSQAGLGPGPSAGIGASGGIPPTGAA